MTNHPTPTLEELFARATPGPWSLDDEYPQESRLRDWRPIDGQGWGALARVAVRLDGKPNAEGEANAALIVALVNSVPAILKEREGQRALGFRDALSAIQYMVANWQQDRRSEDDRRALVEAGQELVDELVSCSPGDWLNTEWKSAQDWIAKLQSAEAERDALKARVGELEAVWAGAMIGCTASVGNPDPEKRGAAVTITWAGEHSLERSLAFEDLARALLTEQPEKEGE